MKTLKNLILILALLFTFSCKSDGQMIPGIGQVICPRATTTPGGIVTINYGYLYNWYAINDARGFTSVGWRIPTYDDILKINTTMGTATAAGGNAKETGFSWWFSPNTGATNAFGFNLRGGAGRVYDGTFYSLKGVSYIHAYYDGYVIRWNASSTSAYMGNDFLTADASNKKLGYGVRVVRISSTLTTQGQTGTYTGNDGKIYRTIAIGTGANLREIVADNLAETKFRDGSLIPKVTTNAAWAALVTAGYCAYENVETNALP